MAQIIGRLAEIKSLENYYDSGRPEFIVVYGRRRVGKTFLIKELFSERFAFYFTGSLNVKNKTNLLMFDAALRQFGSCDNSASKNWFDAFQKLRDLLSRDQGVRKIVFIDEMPWLDTSKSEFLPAFDYFWNSWTSSNPDIMFIGCGSATTWITKNIFKNKGGLHNRLTGRIYLSPFTIGECEDYFQARSIVITRYQLAECYMILGGIPYYLSLFEKGLSFTQNVDKLCFAKQAKLKNEFEELFGSLFKHPGRYLEVVEALASKRSGMSLKEICEDAEIPLGGNVSKIMDDLEQSSFIERYSDFTKRKRETQFYLVDSFTLFYFEFIKNNTFKDEFFWTNFIDNGQHRAWFGYAFEQLCRLHLPQIKRKLGISGVSTSTTTWKSHESSPGAQIDLVIKRNDGVINLCEIKYTKHEYTISKEYASELEKKISVFRKESKTKYAIHLTMITTFGVSRAGYFSMMQSEVGLDDLFAGSG